MRKGQLVVSIYIILIMILISFMVVDIKDGFGIKKAGSTVPDSHEKAKKAIMEDQQDFSAIFVWVNMKLEVIPYYSAISGVNLPTEQGEYPPQIIFGLEWTNAWSTIKTFPGFYSIEGILTSGAISFFIGRVEVDTHLIGSTKYNFTGLAFPVSITEI